MLFFVNVPHIGEKHAYKWAFIIEAPSEEEAKRRAALIITTRDSHHDMKCELTEEDLGEYFDSFEEAKASIIKRTQEMIGGTYETMYGKIQAVPIGLPNDGQAIAFPLHYDGRDGPKELDLKAITVNIPTQYRFRGQLIELTEEKA